MVSRITELKHTKHYDAKIKRPTSHVENLLGYDVIKLEEDFNFAINVFGTIHEKMAKKGQYLAQCKFDPYGSQPPVIIESWSELRREFYVFQNKEKSKENEYA